jgi:hypothetical protein
MTDYVKEATAFINQLNEISPLLAPSLLAGGGAAALSGLSAGATPKRPGESKSDRRKRVLKNMLLGGAAGGLATYAGTKGLQSLQNVLPEGENDPTSKALKFWGSLGAGAGAAGVAHRGVHKKRLDFLEKTLGPKMERHLKEMAGKGQTQEVQKLQDLMGGGAPSVRSKLTELLKARNEGVEKSLIDDYMSLLYSKFADPAAEGSMTFARETGLNTDVGREVKDVARGFKDDVIKAFNTGGGGWKGLQEARGRAMSGAKRMAWRHPRLAALGLGATVLPTGAILGSRALRALSPSITTYD